MRRVGKDFSGRVTPLFPTMVIQNQAKLGEGSKIPTDPHYTPTIIQPLTQPQKTQKPRKSKRKDTQVPQPSGPTEHVADKAVHKELGNSLVRAATTASSLEAEQDSETIGIILLEIRFEKVIQNIPLILNYSQEEKTLIVMRDRLKRNEWMDTCYRFTIRWFLIIKKNRTTQANEIASLKRRVKKLEQTKRSRTHGLKRLRKVSATTRVESSSNEEDLGEDASKQERRINAINTDEDITLVSVQDDADKEMFDVDTLNGKEVFVAGQNENVVEKVVDRCPKLCYVAKLDKGLSQDKGKGILVELEKPLKKKDQLKLDERLQHSNYKQD
ncbi:hypothetical protein Tco_1162712 [Tanacetum coccineum]